MMKSEQQLCHELMARFYVDGGLKSTVWDEINAIYIMRRKGFVIANVTIDSRLKTGEAVIEDITVAGKAEFSRVAKMTDSNAVMGEMAKIAIQAQLDNDKARDNVLLHLASGGVTLAFGVMTFTMEVAYAEYICWFVSVVLWIGSLLSLLMSFITSRKMFNNDPSLTSSVESREKYAVAKSANKWLNRIALWLFILGLVCFTVYVVSKSKGLIK